MTERKVEYGTVETKACPLLLAGLMANPNVADKDGNINDMAETNAQCGDWCKQWINGDCAVVEIAKYLRGPVAVKDVTPVAGL